MTGSELLAYVKKIFVRTDKDTELYECMTDIVVDMRLRLLSDDYSYETTISSALSEGEYIIGVPSDFGHLLTSGVGIRDTSADDVYNPLQKISKARFDEIYQDNFSSTTSNRNTGTPCHYAYFGRQIFVGPAVDHGNYEFRLNYTTDGVADIISTTDPVPFTDKYRRIVRDGVLMLIYKQLEAYALADRYEADYERGLSKIQSNDDFNNLEHSPMVYNGF
jgi:hypothetical protein